MQTILSSLSPVTPVIDKNNFSLNRKDGNWEEVNYKCVPEQTTYGHYHQKDESELFFIISGVVEVSIKNKLTNKLFLFTAKSGDKFIIKSNDTYSLYTLTKCKWLNLVSGKNNIVENYKPEIFNVVELFNSVAA
jgi:hypothetical protein